MRALGLLVIVAGCGNTSDPPRQQVVPASPPKVVAPTVSAQAPSTTTSACTRTLAVEPLAAPPAVTDLEWLSDHEIAVGLMDGLVILDTSGKAARTYRVPVRALRRVNASTLMVVQFDRVATIDLASGCMRESHGLTIEDVAIDTVHRRFFVLTPSDLVRIDAPTLDVALSVARPLDAAHISYAPATDRVLVLTRSPSVQLLDPTSLGLASAITLRGVPDLVWSRPGTKEAWFSYYQPCVHPKREIAKNPCLDPETAWGQTLGRVELPGGRLVGATSIRYYAGSEVTGAFSDDGRQFVIADAYKVQLMPATGKPRELPALAHDGQRRTRFAFDPSGSRIARVLDAEVHVDDAKTGTSVLTAPLPTP